MRRITYHVPYEDQTPVEAGDCLVSVHKRTGALSFWAIHEAREGRSGPCDKHWEEDEPGTGCCTRWVLMVERVSLPPEGAHLLDITWDRSRRVR